MDALSRPLLESELKVLSTLKELDDAAQPAGLDHIRQALHPLPCHQTVAYLLQQGVIGHPPSLSGTPNETLYVLTPQGERVLADYQANKRKPTPDPKLHEAPPKDTPGLAAKPRGVARALRPRSGGGAGVVGGGGVSWTHLHLIAEAAGPYEGGGDFIVRARWGVWTRRGKLKEGAGGIGPCVSGDCPLACAAECARLTRKMLARWRRQREECPWYLPLWSRA